MKVVFLQVKNFLFSGQNTNPFFDPIISVCEKNGIDWEIWYRDRKIKTGYPKDHVRKYGWRDSFLTLLFIIFSRVFRLNNEKSFLYAGKILFALHILPLDIDLFITNVLCGLENLSYVYPNIRIAEVQHGVVYPGHITYFEPNTNILQKIANHPKFEFWLFGPGYLKAFTHNEYNRLILNNKLSVIGALSSGHYCRHDGDIKKRIVVASQMVDIVFSQDVLIKIRKIYEAFFDEIFNQAKDIEIIFRHHPSFHNCIDLTEWKEKYPTITYDENASWEETYSSAYFLVTISSTSAFDAASYGVPTLVLNGDLAGLKNLLCDSFDYPLSSLTVKQVASMSTDEYRKCQERVKAWYAQYYEPFNDKNCLRLLRS
jgi:hypothetical protein